MNDLPLVTIREKVDLPVALVEQMHEYARASKSTSTVRAYSSALRAFCGWCESMGVTSVPAAPSSVAGYVAHMASTSKVATIERHLAAIAEAHRLVGLETPTTDPAVTTVMKGIRRTLGVRQEGKEPVLVAHLRRIVEVLPSNLLGTRDRALLLLGFSGAFRRSELVALDVADLDFREDGLVVTIRWSKTDQEGNGRQVGVPFGSCPTTCPVRALRRWLTEAAITEGPVFRPVNRHGQLGAERLSGKAVGLVVQRSVGKIGLESADFGGHSLRAGLATAAAGAGVSELAIMRQTGHRSLATLRRYVRPASLFIGNAAAQVGL